LQKVFLPPLHPSLFSKTFKLNKGIFTRKETEYGSRLLFALCHTLFFLLSIKDFLKEEGRIANYFFYQCGTHFPKTNAKREKIPPNALLIY